MAWLKVGTAIDVWLGPFVDATDGDSEENSLTITQPDVRLSKNGGAWAQKNAAGTLAFGERGWYKVALDSTDTNTLGTLIVSIHEPGALYVWREFQVVPASVYDGLISGSLAMPGQTAPPATGSLADFVAWIYKTIRNRRTQSATEGKLYADNATTVDQKWTVGEAGSVVDVGEMGVGP